MGQQGRQLGAGAEHGALGWRPERVGQRRTVWLGRAGHIRLSLQRRNTQNMAPQVHQEVHPAAAHAHIIASSPYLLAVGRLIVAVLAVCSRGRRLPASASTTPAALACWPCCLLLLILLLRRRGLLPLLQRRPLRSPQLSWWLSVYVLCHSIIS